MLQLADTCLIGMISSLCIKPLMSYRCISGVLADKLVVLVTHQLQYAQHADSILVLREVLYYMSQSDCDQF